MAKLTAPLYICGAGAVTAAGLNSSQTIAAIRASLSAYDEYVVGEPFGAVQTVSRITAHHQLRRTYGEWLVNMAARALEETLGSGDVDARSTCILLAPPEGFREHPAFADIAQRDFLDAVIGATGHEFHPSSRAIDGGAAAGLGLLSRVSQVLAQGDVKQVLLGGVDSLVNDKDIARLEAAGRLRSNANSDGMIPGEAAAFVRIAGLANRLPRAPLAQIHGVGMSSESDSVLSERFSQGHAMLAALREALDGARPTEPDIVFVVRNSNGERYDGWEQMIAQPRFYRTRREMLPTAYPAMTVGDVGSASGALALMVAADSLDKGYAPGPVAMVEVASEGGFRAAALVSRVG
ncbi:hypothetical protein FJW05_24285 [Mesorhizobium sp. B2-9-1]|uniref:hypothetical protein n=1 Tax=unclassified Mesorhizobium TaxID=325217 RepID=UPI001126EB75|nr:MULTISPECIES: hypothetical protein [unclassified Mesorhizobium]TPI41534.1 hypothetical protein FJW05_24285 [Mesorhizobium sp. B2-9-1]TPJ29724.1 hypothetical protein FJ425_07720 [Mesorhizobium sp. B2-7-2]